MPQDFSRQNLRGRSFKGQNLAGANFSGADIRGVDFSGANLRGADFSHATAGLQKRWIIILILSAFLVSILSAFVSVFGSAQTPNSVFTVITEPYINIRYLTLLAQAGVLFLLTVGWGFQRALEAGAIIPVITWSITKVLAISGIISSTKVVLAIQSGILGGAVVGTWVLAITGVMTIAGSVLIAITTIHHKLTDMILVGAITITSAGVGILSLTGFNFKTIIVTGSGVIIAACLAVYVSWRILVCDDKFSWIWALAVNLASTGGTSFRYADLSNANFARTVLKGTDFRDAILKQTWWSNAQRLDFARVGNSYLKHLQIQQLLVSNNGENQNFDGLNLTDINLSNTRLTDASFIRANLNHANLQNAILLRAKLVQTQLDATDFTGATLTGAYIEDWNITTDTKFDKVRCEYVYMRLPTKEKPDPLRKPDNNKEVFAQGEFGDFIKPIFDTLDLYHNQGVDPRAIAISFKQLAENHPEADLRIVGMEVRGEDKFLLRAKTAAMADKSELSAEYFDTYNQIKGLPEREIKLLLAEKDNQIRRLENMVMTALERPSFYSNVEQVGFMTNNPGGFSVGGSVDGDINNVQGENNQQRVSNKSSSFNLQNAQFAGGLLNADTVNAHQIGGNITNYNPEQKQNLAEAAAEIQQLLNQLSQTYPTATTSEKMTVVARAVDEIENNPTLKARVSGALKTGGTEAFKELIDHPLVNILLASIEGWQEAE
ncbi:pentapeptide repeat-containing protein [Nostoc sp.]